MQTFFIILALLVSKNIAPMLHYLSKLMTMNFFLLHLQKYLEMKAI